MIILVHGGAGLKKPSRRSLAKLTESLASGFAILRKGGASLDAVIASITVLEDSGLFNAGTGGNLQFDGIRRLDASLMEGRELRAGAVIGLEGIQNPVLAARHVMDLPHVMLTDRGARKIAIAHKLPLLPEPGREAYRRLERMKKINNSLLSLYQTYFSTVGAVALDCNGNCAAGSSTGGIPAMLPGRVGDTPVIGAGIFADNALGAVACTGVGEYIIRLSLAKEICMHMKTLTPYRAASLSLRRLNGLGGEAGIILIDKRGRFTLLHTTAYMPAGFATRNKVTVREGFRKALK
jgi:L-asparaginase / beta-aspartyl-peptidase